MVKFSLFNPLCCNLSQHLLSGDWPSVVYFNQHLGVGWNMHFGVQKLKKEEKARKLRPNIAKNYFLRLHPCAGREKFPKNYYNQSQIYKHNMMYIINLKDLSFNSINFWSLSRFELQTFWYGDQCAICHTNFNPSWLIKLRIISVWMLSQIIW